MNRRALALILWLLYSAGSLWFGLLPHQHHDARFGFDRNCIACVWRVANTTDTPAEQPAPIVQHSVVVSVSPPVVAVADAEFVLSTASRAPPAMLA